MIPFVILFYIHVSFWSSKQLKSIGKHFPLCQMEKNYNTFCINVTAGIIGNVGPTTRFRKKPPETQ